ncbi:hypothetical protein OEA41_009246 [Lepraria neglecta]|uniref:Uncharacterized protein n=1 Tax=Lepraria neglecta TaxID=209136 RepID=A0AAD9Z3X5_9LECA|nr:hypothetical protein OEA41_009246 [Lepraria neglecta]
MASGSDTGDLGAYPVPGTRVNLYIYSTSAQKPIPDRNMLMCVIEAQNVLAEVQAGDPIENGKLEFHYGTVQITLEDLGSPKGRFLNDIAAWTLRGMAEWMNQFETFKELTFGVYYNQYYCGTAVVELLTGNGVTANATETTTAVSKTGGIEAA